MFSRLAQSVEKTANSVGHRVGQYVDAHASGGLLTYFATTNVVCLVPRQTTRALQILSGANGQLILDGNGVEGPQAFNTHWTVINEGNNVIRLHNNFNFLAINNNKICLLHFPSGAPQGAETQLRVAQSTDLYVTLESVKEPGCFFAVDPKGQLAHGSLNGHNKQMIPRLVYTQYGAQPVQNHSYRL